MEEINPREIFDKAYSYLIAGEIADAAVWFQFVVENPDKFGGQAVRIAQQRILWYCIPLDIVIAEMKQSHCPVDIHFVIVDHLCSDARYTETEFKSIIKSVEAHLANMPICLRVGENLWVYRTVIEKLASCHVSDVINSYTPVSFASIFRKEWPEFCLKTLHFLITTPTLLLWKYSKITR